MAPNLLLGGLSPGGENMGDIVIPELKEKIEKLQVMVGYEVRFIFIFLILFTILILILKWVNFGESSINHSLNKLYTVKV